MKELSIEEKAKAYDEALKVLHKYDGANIMFSQSLKEEMFPELKESEDEKIRKEIISFVEQAIDAGYGIISKERKEKWIAWLEKQGEQKSIDDLTQQEAMDIAVAKCFEQGEQKPADKVEPKFHEGEWIVFNGLTLLINEVVQGYYRTISRSGIPNSYGWDIDNIARLWTIQDAKDGDVLINKSGSRECPFIFKETKPSDIKTDVLNPLTVLGYCGIGGAGFTKSSGWGDTANCIYYPATKKQRDILIKAMDDAGYTFDFEKKELKKIEHNAWSEKDELRMENILSVIEGHGYPMEVDWLKSLKDRVQLKQEWSEEDEENFKGVMDALNFCNHEGVNPYDIDPLYLASWIKSLRPQSTWKPSDEQMKVLSDAGNSFRPFEEGHKVLWSLYNDLKKLREE